MSGRPRGARERESVSASVWQDEAQSSKEVSRIVSTRPSPNASAGEGYSSVDLGKATRVSLMLVPQGRGPFREQVLEVLSAQSHILNRQGQSMVVTSQTLFLREPADLAECEGLIAQHYGPNQPATNYVFQPPCCGAALALEAWAIGTEGVQIDRCGAHTLSVSYNGIRWVYCAGIRSHQPTLGVYQQTTSVLQRLKASLAETQSSFERVVRTWFYLGAITEGDAGIQRYKELNRARSDFYQGIDFHCSISLPNIPHGIYPASTGIGMRGTELVAGCLALETERPDALLLPLENPQQTPAYAYHPSFSPHSPKFSRAVALVLGDYVTTWVSGTASVVQSRSRHAGDIKRQTEQTIENIERLISAENFGFHGIRNAGAQLSDLAKIRVYLKRPEDFLQCKAICEQRFGPVPAIYAVADVCRPELLVEIEGVAFSKRLRPLP